MVRKHTGVHGFEISSHIIDQDKFLARFNRFQASGQASKVKDESFALTETRILRSNEGAARPPHFDAEIVRPTTSHIPDQREQKILLLRLPY